MKITFDNVVIRSATLGDALTLNRWWNDGKVMEHAGFPKGLGQTLEETKKSIISWQNRSDGTLFIIEIENEKVGECNYYLEGHIAYPGWKICEAGYQNQGYGPQIILHLFDFLFKEAKAQKIIWDTMVENERAIYVYEEKIKGKKLGTRQNCWTDQAGRLRSAIDYQLTQEEFYTFHPEFYEKTL